MNQLEQALKDIQVHPFTLLTGAGFSYPFGGRLVQEFNNILFSKPAIQKNNELRRLFLSPRDATNISLGRLNFEEILQKVREGEKYSASDLNLLEESVKDVYIQMDRDMNGSYFREKAVNIQALKKFCEMFAPKNLNPKPQHGFFFTLNQDIFIERHLAENMSEDMKYPGINNWASYTSNHPIWDQSLTKVISQNIDWTFDVQSYYVKLHGSFDWVKDDQSSAMVVGTGKEQFIKTTPLLEGYFQLFKHVLNNSDKLLVIGYSFGDDHINKIIQTALHTTNLELHIWDPNVNSEDFRKKIKDFISNVHGMYSYKLHEVFPPNNEHNAPSALRDLYASLFDIQL